jgi:hypothetical protein
MSTGPVSYVQVSVDEASSSSSAKVQSQSGSINVQLAIISDELSSTPAAQPPKKDDDSTSGDDGDDEEEGGHSTAGHRQRQRTTTMKQMFDYCEVAYAGNPSIIIIIIVIDHHHHHHRHRSSLFVFGFHQVSFSLSRPRGTRRSRTVHRRRPVSISQPACLPSTKSTHSGRC